MLILNNYKLVLPHKVVTANHVEINFKYAGAVAKNVQVSNVTMTQKLGATPNAYQRLNGRRLPYFSITKPGGTKVHYMLLRQ